MMPAPTIDHMIYTLSEIAVYCGYHPSQPGSTRAAISEDNRHLLDALNKLSLLIVTGDPGDVAAVSLHETAGKRIELCYSKNRPCTPDETAYITELFTITTDPTSSGNIKFSFLFNLVLRRFKDKILARLYKLCDRLRELGKKDDYTFATLNSRAGVSHNPEATKCSAQIRKLVGTERFPLDSSLMDFLRSWFGQLLNNLQPGSCFDLQSNKRLVHETITISHLLAHKPQAALIPDPTLVHPIRKLGDYHAAISVIIEELAKLDVGGGGGVSLKEVSQRLGFFSSQMPKCLLKQIVHPPPDTRFSGDFLTILNECARNHGTTEVTKEDLSKAYSGKRELLSAPEVVLKASVHCECSLALAFAKSRLTSRIPTTLIIGMSKLPCWWCREFLVTIHDSYPHITIHVPPCSGKLRSGWTLPPETPLKVVGGMHKRLDGEIKQVLTRSIGTRRISNQITPDSDSVLG